MITAADIRDAEFSRAARGYRTDEVDELLEGAALAFEQLKKENSELVKKLDVLVAKIQDYRAEEDSIRTALLTAQRTADEITKKAEEDALKTREEAKAFSDSTIKASRDKATAMLNEAQTRARSILASAKTDSDSILRETEKRARAYAADTKKRAGEILAESRERSVKIVFEAGEKRRIENELFEKTKQAAADYRRRLLEMYKHQVELIDKLPELAAIAVNEVRPDDAPAATSPDNTPDFNMDSMAVVDIDNTSQLLMDEKELDSFLDNAKGNFNHTDSDTNLPVPESAPVVSHAAKEPVKSYAVKEPVASSPVKEPVVSEPTRTWNVSSVIKAQNSEKADKPTASYEEKHNSSALDDFVAKIEREEKIAETPATAHERTSPVKSTPERSSNPAKTEGGVSGGFSIKKPLSTTGTNNVNNASNQTDTKNDVKTENTRTGNQNSHQNTPAGTSEKQTTNTENTDNNAKNLKKENSDKKVSEISEKVAEKAAASVRKPAFTSVEASKKQSERKTAERPSFKPTVKNDDKLDFIKDKSEKEDEASIPSSLKYQGLKFGDDYSIEDDEEEPDNISTNENEDDGGKRRSFFKRRKK